MTIGEELHSLAESVHREKQKKIIETQSFGVLVERLRENARRGLYSCDIKSHEMCSIFNSRMPLDCDLIGAFESVGVKTDIRYVSGSHTTTIYRFSWGD